MVAFALLKPYGMALGDTGRTDLIALSRWRHGFESRTGCQASIRSEPLFGVALLVFWTRCHSDANLWKENWMKGLTRQRGQAALAENGDELIVARPAARAIADTLPDAASAAVIDFHHRVDDRESSSRRPRTAQRARWHPQRPTRPRHGPVPASRRGRLLLNGDGRCQCGVRRLARRDPVVTRSPPQSNNAGLLSPTSDQHWRCGRDDGGRVTPTGLRW